jgi:hypothetical protein
VIGAVRDPKESQGATGETAIGAVKGRGVRPDPLDPRVQRDPEGNRVAMEGMVETD